MSTACCKSCWVTRHRATPITSYHLSVTVDDHLQDITLVTRGVDVLPSTHVHGLLQKLLGYETPRYAHHQLSSFRHGGRSPAGHHAGDPRRRRAAVDACPRPAAKAAGLRDTALRPSPAIIFPSRWTITCRTSRW